jgi:predicted metal-dependent phosphoesterase TrpH
MLIDIHTHTNLYSPCSILEPSTLIYRAKELGLSGLAITEHNTLWTKSEISELSKLAGDDLLILNGIELSSSSGHLLIFGYNEIPDENTSIDEIVKEVHNGGGIVIAAHLFRNGRNIEKAAQDLNNEFNGLDGIEILNGNQSRHENRHALQIYDELNITTLAGSDAHSYDMIGKYATWFYNNINNETDFIKEIKAGRCRPIKRSPALTY